MAEQTVNYNLTKPLPTEFYDIGAQNGNMDIIDRALKEAVDKAKQAQETGTDAAAAADAARARADEAYELAGRAKTTADQATAAIEAMGDGAEAVATHNQDPAAHPDIRLALAEASAAAENAQTAADLALETITRIAFTIDAIPTQNGALTYNGSVQTPSWNSYNPEALTLGGVTSGTNAGEYTATFTPVEPYTWSDGTADAKEVVWRINRASVAVPAQSGVLTYTGSAQSPSWSGYDSAKLTLGGTTSGTGAGSYNASFAVKPNYQWPDGTTVSKTVRWSIGKAAGSLRLNKTSMALNISAKAGTIAVTRAGDGAITAKSSNTGVATVAVNGTEVTVTSQAKGSATITISVAEGTNYTAPGDQTCSVTVTYPVTTLDSNAWATIRQASDAGQAANYWSVGDTKSITIHGAVGNFTFSNLSIQAFIIGINHNSSREGGNRIHFQLGKIDSKMVGLCDSQYDTEKTAAGYFNMNTSRTNSGGWNGCNMRKNILGSDKSPTSPAAGTLLAALPSDLRASMKTVTKYTDNTGGGSNTASYVTATTEALFLLSEFEVFGTRNYANSAEQTYQLQYDYYKAGNSRVRYKHSATGTAVWWWLRSPGYNNSYYFCNVYSDGYYNYYNASWSAAVAPGFAV